MSAVKKTAPYSFGQGLVRNSVADQVPKKAPEPKAARIPSRTGKRAITFYAVDEAWAQLRTVTIHEPGESVQSLMMEALNDLFTKRGLNRFD
jgi:hypothetical protein